MGTLLMILLALYGTISGGAAASRSPGAERTQPAPAPQAENEAPSAQRAGPSAGRLLVVGDSLAVGTEAPLARLLPGWRITTSAFTGRHTDDGVAEITGRGSLPDLIVVSLGTNDDPSATSAFAGEIESVLGAAGPSGCVIWANIVRPPYAGVSYAGYNRVLERLSLTRPNLVVVDWSGIVHSQPGLIGSDGVHATPRGYAVRAQAIASAIATCGAGGGYGGTTGGVPGE